jgi:hypothetical protein
MLKNSLNQNVILDAFMGKLKRYGDRTEAKSFYL